MGCPPITSQGGMAAGQASSCVMTINSAPKGKFREPGAPQAAPDRCHSVVGWLVRLWDAQCEWPWDGVSPRSLWGAGHLCLQQVVTRGHGLTLCAGKPCELRHKHPAHPTRRGEASARALSSHSPFQQLSKAASQRGGEERIAKAKAIKGRNQTPSLEEVLRELFWF